MKERVGLVCLLGLATGLGCGSAPPTPPPPHLARLVVTGAEDVEVRIDGQLVAVPEPPEPLALDPGSHFVTVTQNGFHPYATRLELAEGEEQELAVDLAITGQRIAAIGLLTVGGLGITSGIVLGAIAVNGQRNDADDQFIDDHRAAGGVAGLVGLGIFITGGALYVLDEPVIPGEDEGVRVVPVVGPKHGGAAVEVRF